MTTLNPALSFRIGGGWHGVGRNLFIIIPVGLTLWLIIVPLIELIQASFQTGSPGMPGYFTLSKYQTAYFTPLTYTTFLNTAIFAALATSFALAIAILSAWLIERTDLPLRNVAWAFLLVPMAMPGILYAIAWVYLLGPEAGLINIFLRNLLSYFGLELARGPINIFSLGGLIFLEGLRGVTTVFLMIVGCFRMMDPALEEAARVSGASARHTIVRVTLPILFPALLSAWIFNFMSSLESLEIPMIVGLPAKIYVFSSYVYFSTQKSLPPDYGLAAALGVVFLVVSTGLVLIYWRLLGGAERFATVTGKGYRPRVTRLGIWKYPAFGVFILYFTLTILVPVLTLVYRSLLPYLMRPSLQVLDLVSLKNYRSVLTESELLGATINTLIIMAATASVTMMLSITVSWVIVRTKARGRTALDIMTFMTHAIPGVTIAVALVYLYLRAPLKYFPIYGTVWIIILGLVAGYLSFGVRSMNAAMTHIHRELEEAAHTSGAGRARTLWKVTLPLLLPAFVSGWVWVATHSMRAFSIPLMLKTRKNRPLSVVLWDLWDRGESGEAAALGVLLIITLLVVVVGGRWLVARLSRQE